MKRRLLIFLLIVLLGAGCNTKASEEENIDMTGYLEIIINQSIGGENTIEVFDLNDITITLKNHAYENYNTIIKYHAVLQNKSSHEKTIIEINQNDFEKFYQKISALDFEQMYLEQRNSSLIDAEILTVEIKKTGVVTYSKKAVVNSAHDRGGEVKELRNIIDEIKELINFDEYYKEIGAGIGIW